MTSSTPEIRLRSGGRALTGEVAGHGDLTIEVIGAAADSELVVRIGRREVEVRSDADGRAVVALPGLLGEVAGRLEVHVDGARQVVFVRPTKLSGALLGALVDELEGWQAGAAQSAAGLTEVGRGATRDAEVDLLDTATGLARAAAAGIRRRPIVRVEQRMAAIRGGTGPRSAAEARWLAAHPAAAVRLGGGGVSVKREVRTHPHTLENRGAVAAYERIASAVESFAAGARQAVARIEAGRPAREAFLTERGNLWEERDAPKVAALGRRVDRLEAQAASVIAARRHTGLQLHGPRLARPVRTPRTDAHPDYWRLWRADALAAAVSAYVEPAPLVVDSLDVLWERWCLRGLVEALTERLGAPTATPAGGDLVGGERWGWTSRVVLDYEPTYAFGEGTPRKLVPGRPWRPDFVLTRLGPTPELHVFDAKFRVGPGGGAPWDALRELVWKYGETIGGADRLPQVASVWALHPGPDRRTLGPAMLDPSWPAGRLRAGCVGLLPGRRGSSLVDLLRRLGFP